MAAPQSQVGGHSQEFGGTLRTDRWWLGPLLVLGGLSAFIVYATWAGFQAAHYYSAPYLSPFYSPVIWTDLSAAGHAPLWHAWFGEWPAWWPSILPASPAMLILVVPASFRVTCYYYRKAYYRAFAGSPPGCAVVPLGKGKRTYKGETGLLIFQNLHRYALYLALAYIPILGFDAAVSFYRDGQFGVGVGSIVLTLNVVFLAGYTFGCHSLRHLIGGRYDCMTCERGKPQARYKLWKGVGFLNMRHQHFAWVSLIWVGFTDAYVRLVSMGIITDLNTWN